MTDNQIVTHINQGQKYKVQFERSAVKDRDGFKVEALGDDLDQAMKDAAELYQRAQGWTAPAGKIEKSVATIAQNLESGEVKP